MRNTKTDGLHEHYPSLPFFTHYVLHADHKLFLPGAFRSETLSFISLPSMVTFDRAQLFLNHMCNVSSTSFPFRISTPVSLASVYESNCN